MWHYHADQDWLCNEDSSADGDKTLKQQYLSWLRPHLKQYILRDRWKQRQRSGLSKHPSQNTSLIITQPSDYDFSMKAVLIGDVGAAHIEGEVEDDDYEPALRSGEDEHHSPLLEEYLHGVGKANYRARL